MQKEVHFLFSRNIWHPVTNKTTSNKYNLYNILYNIICMKYSVYNFDDPLNINNYSNIICTKDSIYDTAAANIQGCHVGIIL